MNILSLLLALILGLVALSSCLFILLKFLKARKQGLLIQKQRLEALKKAAEESAIG